MLSRKAAPILVIELQQLITLVIQKIKEMSHYCDK